MITRLDKTLKRELNISGRAFIVAVSPDGLKVTLKGKRNGLELGWADLVSGDAALALALNASVGKLAQEPKLVQGPARAAATRTAAKPKRRRIKRPASRGRG
jgi:hypothetical protein